MATTLGRELIRQRLPEKYKGYADKVLDKKTTTELMTAIAKEDPDGYVDVLQSLNNFAQAVVSLYGRESGLPFKDVRISTALRNYNKQLREVINKVLNNDSLTDKQKEQKIIDLGYKYTQKVQDVVFSDHDKRNTAFASQINSGSRGNKTQLMQLMFGNMLMKDALNRDMPYLMVDPYVQGISPMSYWVSSSSGRKGFYDLQAATGQAGYLGKRVTAATHDTVIGEEDCGTTDTGVPYPANSSKNIGAVLLKPWKNYPAGTVVNAKMVEEAEDDDDDMILRSPLTCKSKHGVCAKCNGLGENGKFPHVGEFVSLNAARSFVEPITQSGISSKHTGGVGGKKVIDPEGEDQPTGFKSVERMFSASKVFPGAAVLAPVDGTVTKITPAAQGGSYITVGANMVYASPARTVNVKVGDKVSAGDMLTNGVPNPLEVVDYKGLGEGRRYFTDKLNDILKKAGAGVDRRNVESFARAYMNKVQITSEDGYKDWLPGDIVDYSRIVADYEPREDAKEQSASHAINQYLEKPVLFYSVGTRITPEVANTLKKYKFDTVTASPTKPPFTAKFMRPAEALQHSAEWLPRLSGERLRDSVFDAAREGVTDAWDAPSYVDKIVIAPFKPTT